MRGTRVGVLVVGAGLVTATVAACSGGSSASQSAAAASSSASSSASPTGNSSSTPSSAGQQYLSLIAPIDADLAGFLAQPDSAPIAQVQAAAAKVAGDETPLLDGLRKASWPSSAQSSISTLEAAIPAEQAAYQACSTAASVAAIKTVLTQNQAAIAERVTASREVRQVLGLPATTPSASNGAGTSSPTGSATA